MGCNGRNGNRSRKSFRNGLILNRYLSMSNIAEILKLAETFYKAAAMQSLNQGAMNALKQASDGLNTLVSTAEGDVKNRIISYKSKIDQIYNSKSIDLDQYVSFAKSVVADAQVKAVNPAFFADNVAYALMHVERTMLGRG